VGGSSGSRYAVEKRGEGKEIETEDGSECPRRKLKGGKRGGSTKLVLGETNSQLQGVTLGERPLVVVKKTLEGKRQEQRKGGGNVSKLGRSTKGQKGGKEKRKKGAF